VYDPFPYNSFMEFRGKYYAAGSDGIRQIDTGSLDETADITWTISTGDLDFDDGIYKRVSDFYLAARTTGEITLNLYVDEVFVETYNLTVADVETLKQTRSLIGKGARGRYWKFEITGASPVEFDAYNVAIYKMGRRI
jgi:hypothetical protein